MSPSSLCACSCRLLALISGFVSSSAGLSVLETSLSSRPPHSLPSPSSNAFLRSKRCNSSFASLICMSRLVPRRSRTGGDRRSSAPSSPRRHGIIVIAIAIDDFGDRPRAASFRGFGSGSPI
ncbi:hypothetical protein BS78_10G028300 [Paspalum vaginatum]|nr:hypothetical protein BS78_10G028300 [Paspalum vaginatum]